MKAQKIFNQKLKGYVYFLLDYDSQNTDKRRFVNSLVSNLQKTSIGFAGFKNKKALKRYLQFQLFDDKEIKNLPKYQFNKQQILHIIKDTLSKCHDAIPSNPTRIFIFPGFNSFVTDKMGGVGGFSPWKNTILLNINPTVNNWEAALKNSIAHEYNHSVVYNSHRWESLLDSLIFEGFAEHFREQIVGGDRAPWTKAVAPKVCKEHYSKLKAKFLTKDYQLYSEVFFGGGKYPLWLGYSLGYQIVREFLRKNKAMDWDTIITTKPKDIVQQSGF